MATELHFIPLLFRAVSAAALVFALLPSVGSAASGRDGGSWSVEPISEFPRKLLADPQKEGLSGIAGIGGDEYYVVNDKFGLLHKVEIGIDRNTGVITNFERKTTVELEGRIDLEAVVWDPANKVVWVVDERDCSIRSYDPDTGKQAGVVKIPEVYHNSSRVVNASFESLAMESNGLFMWTCNEAALRKDGGEAVKDRGSDIRIQRFARKDFSSPWVPSGQWCYQTEKNASISLANKRVCGVAELLAMPDGKIVALERRLNVAKWRLPTLDLGLYEIDFSNATDVSNVDRLCDAEFVRVSKKRLYSANTGFGVYEGICFGPELNDGTKTLILISDGDEGAASRLMTMRLKKTAK
jgi:hypothetical protein